MSIVNLPLAKVKRGKRVTNDRQYFDPTGILELAISIAREGLAQPITVRPSDEDYEIVAGERRYRAHCLLRDEGCTYTNDQGETITIPPGQITTIDAIIRTDLDDKRASNIMLAENTGRADLNPIEEAYAYNQRRKEFKSSVEEIAETAGVSPERVKRRLDLLKLIDDVQQLIRHGNFPLGHAEAMIPLDTNRQRIAARIFAEAKGGITLARFKHIVNDLLTEQSTQSLFDLENFWVEQVQKAEMPRRGKKAYVPAPTRRDLPPVKRNTKWTAPDIIDQYIADLLKAGFEAEAGALGNVYHTLVRHNYMAVPTHTAIPDPGEELKPHESPAPDHRK